MNFKDLYVQYCQEQTDAPKIFHEVLSYLLLACVVNRNVWMAFGFKKIYPNLYILIVAPSSLHRKSWSQSIAMNLLKEINPLYPLRDCSSRESFISEFADPDRHGCGLLKIDELSGFMNRIKHGQHFNGFLQDLSSAYDGETIIRRKGVSEKEKEIFVINEPYLNLTACCSNEWLNKSLESSDIVGGGFARFLWAVHESPLKNPWPRPKNHDPIKFDQLINKLITIRSYLGEAYFNREAAILYDEWYSDFRGKNQGTKWDQNYERLTGIAQKLSILNCLSRMEEDSAPISTSIEIIKKDVGLALCAVEESALHLNKIVVGDSPAEVQKNKVLRFIEKHNNVTRSNLLNNIWGLDSWHLNNILETLADADLIIKETKTAQNNKNVEVFTIGCR